MPRVASQVAVVSENDFSGDPDEGGGGGEAARLHRNRKFFQAIFAMC